MIDEALLRPGRRDHPYPHPTPPPSPQPPLSPSPSPWPAGSRCRSRSRYLTRAAALRSSRSTPSRCGTRGTSLPTSPCLASPSRRRTSPARNHRHTQCTPHTVHPPLGALLTLCAPRVFRHRRRDRRPRQVRSLLRLRAAGAGGQHQERRGRLVAGEPIGCIVVVCVYIYPTRACKASTKPSQFVAGDQGRL